MEAKKRKFKKKTTSLSKAPAKVESDVLELNFWKGKVKSNLGKSLKSLKDLKLLSKNKE